MTGGAMDSPGLIETWLTRLGLLMKDFRFFGRGAIWLGHFPGAGRLPWLRRPRGALIPVRLQALGRTVHVRHRSADVPTLRQVFVARDYDIAELPQAAMLAETYLATIAAGKTPVIVDGGANVGFAALWFAHAYPQATVVAVEPERKNYDLLVVNTSGVANIIPLHAALLDRPGQVRIANPGAEAWGFQTMEVDAEAADAVPAVTVPDLIARVPNGRPFLVKVDIEGAEDALFRSNTEWVSEAAALIVEFHDRLFPGEGRARRVLDRLIRDDVDIVDRGENLFFVKHRTR